jgi:hypothetical protein
MQGKLLYPWMLVVLLILAVIYLHERSPRTLAADGQVSSLKLPDGKIYSGEMRDGLMHGKGLLEMVDGSRYEGEFAEGDFHGRGEFITEQGHSYKGNFVKGVLTGEGESHRDEEHYQGEFVNWQYHGQGVLTTPEGVLRGQFQYGYADGEGEFTAADSGEVKKGLYAWGKLQDPEEKQLKYVRAKALEAAIYRQLPLIEQLTDALLPSDPETINLYFVGVGGYGRQDVFRDELEVFKELMENRFAAQGRSLLLLNNQQTLDTWPLATATSLNLSLQSVARKMNAEQDILFVYLTSHGSRDHRFSLEQEGLQLPDLPAETLGEILREVPVKWKVVVVSACYSGGFIPYLEDPHTLVMTAARKDRRSFGCSDDSEMTYFGRAYFVDALPRASSFEGAFEIAKSLIRQREKEMEKKVKHSLPQISMGEAIRQYLPLFWQTLAEDSQ